VRDKIIGTLVPPGGYIGVGIVGLMATTGHGNGCVIATDAAGQVIRNTCPAAGPGWVEALASAVLTFVIFVLPLVTAGYLALRLRWGRGRRATAMA